MIVLIFLVCFGGTAFCSAPKGQELNNQERNLINALALIAPANKEAQYDILRDMLERITGFNVDVDAYVARYSKASKRFNELAHTDAGKNIIEDVKKINLLQELEKYAGEDIQYRIFETLLDISKDKEVDANIARYSLISPRFNNLIKSERGQRIIKTRKSVYLKPLQEELKRILRLANVEFDIDIVKNGVNAQDKSGNTALIKLASFYPFLSATKRDINIRYINQAANDLIFYGANLNIQNQFGQTALMQSARFDARLGILLLASGANPNLQDENGRTALMIYLFQHDTGDDDFTWPLIAKTDLFIKDNEGRVALNYASHSTWFVAWGATKIEDLMKQDKKRWAKYVLEKRGVQIVVD